MKTVVKAFFAGLVFGLIILSIVGATLRPRHLIDEFKRFHSGFSSRNFSVTAREIQLIVDTVDSEKIIAVVGGTSVFQGTGQSQQYVWTTYLQEILGSRYKVLNLARQAGRPNDFGNIAAEILLKRKSKIIYISDSMLTQFVISLQESFFKSAMFDAWRRGYLLDWPPRDKLMRNALWSSNANFKEAAWGSLLDLPLNFNDLWNYVTYEIAGTVWNSSETTKSFVPLREVVDPQLPPEYFETHGYPPVTDEQMRIIKSQLLPLDDLYWNTIKSESEALFPLKLRAVSIVNVNLQSPYYVKKLGPNGWQDQLLVARHMADILTGIGIGKTLIAQESFDSNDFVDPIHLSVSGGRKLASIIAPDVQALAKSLGYIE
jgi:hypothetical protein